MDITLTTGQVDVSVALSALNLYKTGQYRDAIAKLQEILDVEPRNWQARLFLAACYFKTASPAAAQRSLRFIYDNCNDEPLRKCAFEALQIVNAETTHKSFEVAAEFGALVERMRKPEVRTIEAIIS